MRAQQRTTIQIDNTDDWQFVNGTWQSSPDGELSVPEELRRVDGPSMQGYHFAFYRQQRYLDLHLNFEVRLTGHSDAGVTFRAQDPSHFYLLHFPNCAQASRAGHFWVALSKMDERGYLTLIKLELVRRVPSEANAWLPVTLRVAGNSFSATIGRGGQFTAEDDTYLEAGGLGLFAFNDASLRNLTLEGEPSGDLNWDLTLQPPQNWFHPVPEIEPAHGTWQRPGNLLQFPDGELLLTYAVHKGGFDGQVVPLLTRSQDSGHTWSASSMLTVADLATGRPPRLHITPNGRLICHVRNKGGFITSESGDRGRSWSVPVSASVPDPPEHLMHLAVGPLVNLKDGAMLLFSHGRITELSTSDLDINVWGSHHQQAFVCRSTDDGHSWSPWLNLDGGDPAAIEKSGSAALRTGNLDLTETCAAEMSDGSILALVRPIYSPWMWEFRSCDGGQTWTRGVPGPFAGYATSNMLRTRDGVFVVAHRLPSLTLNCGFEDADRWDEGTIIDSSIWAMGVMLEAEPGLILYVYGDSFETRMRRQFFKVGPTGLEPVSRRLAAA